MVDGIEIDKDIAEETLLPDDLNSLAVGSYVVPDPRKRSQYPYVVLGVVLLSFTTSLICLLYTSPSPRDMWTSRMPSSA